MIVLARLVELNRRLDRHRRQPDQRAQQLRQLGDVGVRDVERLQHLVVVLRVLLRVVGKHQDRSLALHLVGERVDRHDLLHRLLERQAVDDGG